MRAFDWPDGAPTALQALRLGGQPIASSCGGETVCARCVVEVLSGTAGRADDDERVLLDALGAAPNERLACRIRREEVGDALELRAPYW